jgi:tetratricopeptide (TPR) repeat protein
MTRDEELRQGPGEAQQDRPHFFVSYTGVDHAWAEWIAWQLEDAGYTVVVQKWDFRPSSDFVHKMQEATERAHRTIAVLSSAYLASGFGEAEWRVAFAKDPTGEQGLLLPVRVEEVAPPGLLKTRTYIDLVGLNEEAAREELLAGVERGRAKPTTAPPFPAPAATRPTTPESPPFPGAGPAISNLAPRNPNFTGRETLLTELEEHLAAGSVTAVVATHGPGGIGKSQLALEYAHRHWADYDLIWWVSADSPLIIVTGFGGLAPHLGVDVGVNEEAVVSAVLAELGRRDRWLVVFDNAEQAGDVAPYRPGGGGGHILITSRNPVWGAIATPLTVEELDRDEAVAFLLQRTGSCDEETSATLAEELGRLPLALAQAAAYAEQVPLSLAEYLDRYRSRRTELLARGRPVDYPDTVATTWQLNFEAVIDTSQAAVQLLQIAAFLAPEPIPLDLFTERPELLPTDLATAVGDQLAFDDAVGALYRYSLVARDRDGLRLHRLVQAVVRDDLSSAEATVTIERTEEILRAAWPDRSQEPQTWQRCAVLLPHALAIAEHAEDRRLALQNTSILLNEVGIYLGRRAEDQAARQQHERALRIREEVFGPDHPDVAISLVNLGGVLVSLGDREGARDHLQRALTILEAAYGRDHPDVGTTLAGLATALRGLGDHGTARQHLDRAVAIFEAAHGPDHPDVAKALATLSNVLFEVEELESAQEKIERALAIAQTVEDEYLEASALVSLGRVLRARGDPNSAKEVLERALPMLERILGDDHPDVGGALLYLGNVFVLLDDLATARARFERALVIFRTKLGENHEYTQHTARRLRDISD